MISGHQDFGGGEHTRQPNPGEQDESAARVKRQRQAVEAEFREFDRRKQGINRIGELRWDQHRQFSKRLSALGQSASSVLKKHDSGQERMQALTRILNAHQDRSKYLTHRDEQHLEDVREGLTSVHWARVRQLEDHIQDERKKMRA